MLTSLTSAYLSRQLSDNKITVTFLPKQLRSFIKFPALLLAGLLCLGTASQVTAEPLWVTVVQSENSGAYAEFSAALRENLQNSNVALTVLNAEQPLPAKSSLVIAIGMRAASLVANSNAPSILNVMIPKSGHQKLSLEFTKRGNTSQYSSIYLDQPVERHLNLISAAFPDKHRIGVLYSAPPTEELGQLRQKISEHGLKLYEQEVNTDQPLFEALQDVLEHSDVLLSLPAPTIYNSSTLRNILVSTYQTGIPLVGFSSSYVKAGAMCAVFSSPAQIATQASAAILKFGETGSLPPAQYPKFYEIAVNERVAQSLNIKIQSAEELQKKMNSPRRHSP
jgi:putative tryptophan/tyrosine transport system substrate-binding protein